MNYLKKIIFCLSTGIILGSNQHPTQEQINQLMSQAMQQVWQEAMIAKHSINETMPRLREELQGRAAEGTPQERYGEQKHLRRKALHACASPRRPLREGGSQ